MQVCGRSGGDEVVGRSPGIMDGVDWWVVVECMEGANHLGLMVGEKLGEAARWVGRAMG